MKTRSRTKQELEEYRNERYKKGKSKRQCKNTEEFICVIEIPDLSEYEEYCMKEKTCDSSISFKEFDRLARIGELEIVWNQYVKFDSEEEYLKNKKRVQE